MLNDVGLDYIKLGQAGTTLSGGEAQRLKLARELAKIGTGNTLYVLDEPTTGLHFADIEKLLQVLERLTDAGNTVLVIEHNLDVIKTADYVIDLGPEGWRGGAGGIVAQGTPEQVARMQHSHTGRYLRAVLPGPLAGVAASLALPAGGCVYCNHSMLTVTARDPQLRSPRVAIALPRGPACTANASPTS